MMMITLFSAGGESTASLIGSATALLATRPELQHRLRNDRSLIPVFLEETLRFEPGSRERMPRGGSDTSAHRAKP